MHIDDVVGLNTIHHHVISPCACTSPTCGSTSTKPGACNDNHSLCYTPSFNVPLGGVDATDTAEAIANKWVPTTGDHGGVFGIAKDGHVIYGPYNKDDELWSCEDVDLCNGFWTLGDNYGYASTSFYPYTVGCWGPAPWNDMPTDTDAVFYDRPMPTCTTNGCPATSVLGLSLSAIALSITLVSILM